VNYAWESELIGALKASEMARCLPSALCETHSILGETHCRVTVFGG
jgi:hypothetical protein